jgi:diguanylate cyclase (GGDEF)-like protein/PAS domain S-box-containing protein
MLRLYACVTDQHDLRIVALAAFVCTLAGITAVSLLRRAMATGGRAHGVWLAAGAAAFGGGIWATHFIAMLAYLPAAGFRYAVPPMMLALLRAVVGTLAAFALGLRGRPNGWGVAAGGITLGGSIGAMHFTGMAALRPSHALAFAPAYAIAALAAAAAFGLAAIWAVRHGQRAAAIALATLAVCGLHFIAMAGTVLLPLHGVSAAGPLLSDVTPPLLSNGPLAVAIGALTILVLSLALLGAVVDRHLAQRTVAEAARLRRFADAAFEGILFLRGGVVADANAPFCALLGQEREALLGRLVSELLALPGGIDLLGQSGSAEAELVDAVGERHPVELLTRRLGENETVVVVRDISARKQAEARIQHLAHHDSLTGLPNRALFRDRLTQAISMAERTAHKVALLCLDLDGFKAVNDLLGHPAGDEVLIEVGTRLISCLRESDTVARLGGDEFAIVQSFCDQPRGAAALAERVARMLGEPFDVGGQRVCLGASVGIALFPFDARTPEVLMRNADLALSRAKQDGRGLWRFFEQDIDQRLRQRRTMEQDLRRAMLHDELRLHYQPLLDCTTLQIEGFEALLRWPHPERGFISPAEFVPVAEESGLIMQLGHWVLTSACAEAASWPQPWRVAVNLSPAQFRQRDLAQSIRAILADTGLAPWRLELEITEGILIDDAERALAMLRELKALGVHVALDDFGTGYSSLSYLRRFPFDKLKIDASFVQGLGDGGEADAIVRAIMALGRSLSLRITAEGVETPEQLRLLREQACDQVQGYLIGRPMPPAELPALQPAAMAAAAA